MHGTFFSDFPGFPGFPELVGSLPLLLGLIVRNPVFWICNQVMLKAACSATDNSYNVEISHVAR